tara:strand:- start:4258 stop:5286 length:1029 start_codon:yes stop_codon:yes gene_type:complete
MKINKTTISTNHQPYIIAEFSGNHNNNINNFYKLIKVAKKAGANAIKLQTFKPEEITLNSKKKSFLVKHKFKKWNNKTLFQLYQEAYTPWEWHIKIKKEAKKNKLDFISTAFHESSVDFLKKLKVDCIKISSFEFNDHSLIEYSSKNNIPMILSTGMASLDEINFNYSILNKKLKGNFSFLKCTSSYPADLKDLNLNTINFLRQKFKCPIGFSDHSIGYIASMNAISRGASIIEKHICIDKKIGIDSDFSCTPDEFIRFVQNCRMTWKASGNIKFGPNKSEFKSFKNRNSLFIIKKINKGEKFSSKNIASIRPAKGLHPKNLKKLMGKIARKNFNYGDPFKN